MLGAVARRTLGVSFKPEQERVPTVRIDFIGGAGQLAVTPFVRLQIYFAPWPRYPPQLFSTNTRKRVLALGQFWLAPIFHTSAVLNHSSL